MCRLQGWHVSFLYCLPCRVVICCICPKTTPFQPKTASWFYFSSLGDHYRKDLLTFLNLSEWNICTGSGLSSVLHSKSCISLCPFHSQTSSKSMKASASDHDFTAFLGTAAWGDNAEVLAQCHHQLQTLFPQRLPSHRWCERLSISITWQDTLFSLQGCSDPSQNQEGKCLLVHNLVNTHLLCVSVYTCANRGQKLMLGTFFF